MTKRNQDFETLVKKVFVKEYSFKFNESISLDGVRYDLWDPLKGAFVEIIEHANKNKRSIILDRVLKTIRNLNKAETEINYYFLIFNDKITQSDKEYYIKNLIFTKFPIEILDRDDINRLSNNNENSSIKGNSNIKFSPVANIKDKTAPATPTITSIESLDFRTRDYSNEFLKFLLEGSENKQNIKDLLTNLTKEQLVAFILNRVEGKNYNQITKILGISQKAGQQRIFDVLEKLRVKIDDSEILEASRKVRGEKIYGAVDKLRVEIGDNNYFLAGHVWDGEDQMERFVKEGIWENGHTNNDVNAVNSVKKGDVVFLKSTEIGKGKSYLVIKAIGVVLKNLEDGHNLKLNWEIIHNYIKIQGLGKYRRTFARVMPKDVPSIIEKVLAEIPNYVQIINDLHSNLSDLSSEENTETNKSVKNTTSTTIAGLISDTDSGADYLDISKDITAFARVITAKSFKPPLAIALLGKWGSGKSFFMRKLKERVQNLSRSNNSQNAYCSGIAHVHFNAWSYMDSNLWAGIITKIFEGLQKYITNDTLASANKKEIEKALTKKLNIAHDEITDLEYQKESIDNKIETLESQKD